MGDWTDHHCPYTKKGKHAPSPSYISARHVDYCEIHDCYHKKGPSGMRCPQCERARLEAEAIARRARAEAREAAAAAKEAAAQGEIVDVKTPEPISSRSNGLKATESSEKAPKAKPKQNNGKCRATWANAKGPREYLRPVGDVTKGRITLAAPKTPKVTPEILDPFSDRRVAGDNNNNKKGKAIKIYSLRPNVNHAMRDRNENKGKGHKTCNGKVKGKK